ncbi:hypothetical protein HID58_029698 [Brassica napus]|uniref:Uncharacterized protein n=1 Tax=Brassica napus TaxID=3708 RepID=A0ABQ8CDT7_BRANA|nr:hypothetical protein HID58_029698 [Brassica napus]
MPCKVLSLLLLAYISSLMTTHQSLSLWHR